MLYYHFYSISYFIFGNWSGNPKSNLVLIFLDKNSPMSHEGIYSHRGKIFCSHHGKIHKGNGMNFFTF